MSITTEILMQTKLSKSEWDSIEIPVIQQEKEILYMLSSVKDLNTKKQRVFSLSSLMKINCEDEKMQYAVYDKYYKDMIPKTLITNLPNLKKIKLNNADKIRFENTSINVNTAFDTVLINCVLKIINENENIEKIKYKYILKKLLNQNIYGVNNYVINACLNCLSKQDESSEELHICLENIESICNNIIIKQNADIGLYDHQKQLIYACSNTSPKCVFYKASTGTGKTLSPIALVNQGHKVIFVCGARHVGLSLAKSSLSCGLKIAFAYGCNDTSGIRLHNSAAKVKTTNYRTGGIFRIDHTVGDNVELMICDLQSYVYAMHYMKAFNERLENIIMFWDEPTISMDYENHPLHTIIKKNWNENIIPNIILSSATLPKQEELGDMIVSFKSKFGFDNSMIVDINGHDITKSIPVINTDGYTISPHLSAKTFNDFKEMIKRCKENMTLMRYINLTDIEIVFKYLKNNLNPSPLSVFNSIDDITVTSSKKYYIDILENIDETLWNELKNNCTPSQLIKQNVKYPQVKSINRLTTADAYTLTDGPSIYLCKNSEQVASVLLKELNIPNSVLSEIQTKINKNSKINEHILHLEKEIEYMQTMKENESITNNNKKKESKTSVSRGVSAMQSELENYLSAIAITRLPEIYIPNSSLHKSHWTNVNNNSFTSNIEDDIILQIMSIGDITDFYKILLLSGIGVFGNGESCRNSKYTEIIKKMATEKRLYLILADSDYIYGTNYSFSHGIIGKDMMDMSQEKIIQAMGRVGRNTSDNLYTIRIRDNNFINKIFIDEIDGIEARVMNNLLN
jgi:hypothetical protein